MQIRPLDGLVAGFKVQGRRAPAQQGQPTALAVGDGIAQLLPNQIGVLEVMVPTNQLVPSWLLVNANQFHLEFLQQGLFIVIG